MSSALPDSPLQYVVGTNALCPGLLWSASGSGSADVIKTQSGAVDMCKFLSTSPATTSCLRPLGLMEMEVIGYCWQYYWLLGRGRDGGRGKCHYWVFEIESTRSMWAVRPPA
jgi:hypothetical protein